MLNKVILMGRLTADPDVRSTPSGVAVTTFNLAVDRGYVKQSEEKQVDFIQIVCWRKTADFARNYFKKGQLVAVDGSIRTRSYTDQSGAKRYVVEVVANELFFAESKKQQREPENVGNNAAAMNPLDVQYSDEDLPFD